MRSAYPTGTIGFTVRGRPGSGEELSSEAFASATQEALDTAMQNMGLRKGLARTRRDSS